MLRCGEFDKDCAQPVGAARFAVRLHVDFESLDFMLTSASNGHGVYLSRELEADFVFAPSGVKWIDVMQRGVEQGDRH